MKKKRLTRKESFLPDIGHRQTQGVMQKGERCKGMGQVVGIRLQKGGQIDSQDWDDLLSDALPCVSDWVV